MSSKTTPNHEKQRRIKSFVKREGRLSQLQKNAINQHWQHYGRTLDEGMIDITTLKQDKEQLVLEIGFGMGKSLLEMAIANPKTHYIGIEVHRPGVGTLINEAVKADATNLTIYCDDAIDVLEQCIPEHSLDKIQIFFPDPWHKQRHHKRRIIQPNFVQMLRTKLAPSGLLHIATDWEDYATHILKVMQSAEGYSNTVTGDDYAPRPDDRPLTKYEQRGHRLGHDVWDIIFKLNQDLAQT